MTALTDADRRIIGEARKLATLRTADICAYTGDDDPAMAYAVALGRAQWHLNDLLRLVERLDGECGKHNATIAAFDEVASILAAFDWEHDDRQYALERIEMIVLTGGQA